MAEQNADKVALGLLAAFEVPNFYSGLLPSLMTIRRFGAQEEDRSTLQQGVLMATILSSGVIGATSYISKSWLPIVFAGSVMAILIWQYERAILHPHPTAVPINQQPGM